MVTAVRPTDVIAGAGITVWLIGMGITLGIEDPALQAIGGVLWAGGFVVASLAAASAYVRRIGSRPAA